MTDHLIQFLQDKFAGSLRFSRGNFIGDTETVGLLRFQAPARKCMEDMFEKIAFSYARYQMFRYSKHRWRKSYSLKEDEPLRFFVPFAFCEPRKWWYRFAPFRVNMHVAPFSLGHIELEAQWQSNAHVDSGTNRWTNGTFFTGQLLVRKSFSDFAAPTFSVSFAWSK